VTSISPGLIDVAESFVWSLGRLGCGGEHAEHGQEAEQDESAVAVGFRAAYVCDITRDGQPLPDIGSVNGDGLVRSTAFLV
jgi:hypothetical protein